MPIIDETNACDRKRNRLMVDQPDYGTYDEDDETRQNKKAVTSSIQTDV